MFVTYEGQVVVVKLLHEDSDRSCWPVIIDANRGRVLSNSEWHLTDIKLAYSLEFYQSTISEYFLKLGIAKISYLF